MAKFRKKPVVVEAFQFNGQDIPNGVVNRGDRTTLVETGQGKFAVRAGHALIPTLEGPHAVSPGDWIITGIQGEQYPCKPDIFAATYDLVEGDGCSS